MRFKDQRQHKKSQTKKQREQEKIERRESEEKMGDTVSYRNQKNAG